LGSAQTCCFIKVIATILTRQLGQGRSYFSVDNLCVKADDTEFWGSVSYVAIHDAEGPGRHSVSTVRDIDEIKMREQAAEIALIENEQLLSAVEAAQTRLISAINMVPDPFMIFDAKDRLLVWNPAFAEP
jgi:PAS domain-containing protein